jgi:outer membrane lipoprotein-sorting protein
MEGPVTQVNVAPSLFISKSARLNLEQRGVNVSTVRISSIIATLIASALSLGSAQAAPAAPAKPTAPAAASAAVPAALPALSVQQVLDKNLAARGGLSAWRAVKSVAWTGKLGAGGANYEAVTARARLERREREEMQLPFRFEFKRPNKMRLELQFQGKTAVQVFDGGQGYKYRPFLNRTNWEPYTASERQQAASEPGIDGYLIDAAAKGFKVTLDGTESVENHPAYKLKVTLKDGTVRHVWVDGQSFLDIKTDGEPRKLDQHVHPVVIYLRDYKSEHGLMMPHTYETAVQGEERTEKIKIDSVFINPPVDDARFTQPK